MWQEPKKQQGIHVALAAASTCWNNVQYLRAIETLDLALIVLVWLPTGGSSTAAGV